MPEMPENEALARFLDANVHGGYLTEVSLGSFTALKTVSPSPDSLIGTEVRSVSRHGKHIVVDVSGTYLVVHLFLAGWLTWSQKAPSAPLRPGRGSAILRLGFETTSGPCSATFTEAGTTRRLSVWIARDLAAIDGIAELGPEALDLAATPNAWSSTIGASRSRIKTVLKDQRVLAGIGNAYSDEILFAARLSPYATASALTPDEMERLRVATLDVLSAAVSAMDGAPPSRIKAIKKAGFRVHARAGEPCQVCGTTIGTVEFSSRSFEYCPGCQTGGTRLADRSTSRFVK